MMTRKLRVEDMNCTGCAARARNVLMNTRGVVKVIINLDDHEAEVTFDNQSVSQDDLMAALKAAGFGTESKEFCDRNADTR